MKNLNIILRGFLYKKNWTPLSSRASRNSDYTIDFTKCSSTYKKLINKLSEYYNLNIYFTSYDTTPKYILEDISKTFNNPNIFLCSETNSSQFTTTVNALKNIKNNNQITDHTLIIRSDLLLTDYFINIVSSFQFESDCLHILCKENNKTDKAVDVLHVVPNKMYNQFLKFIQQSKLRDTHYIHKHIFTKSIVTDHKCTAVASCKDFFEIFIG